MAFPTVNCLLASIRRIEQDRKTSPNEKTTVALINLQMAYVDVLKERVHRELEANTNQVVEVTVID